MTDCIDDRVFALHMRGLHSVSVVTDQIDGCVRVACT